jgi:hypothetical protein
MALKVTALTSKDFELLEAVGPKSLPDRPTAQGKSAAEIKLALEKPYRFIFNWTQRLANETNEQFSSIEATQKTLADTFSNYVLVTTYSESLKRISDLENKYVTDVTRWAAFDGMGNSIIETYATKSELETESTRASNAEKANSDAISSAILTASSDATSKSNDSLAKAKAYADGKISSLVNGADSAYDTLKEIENSLKSGSDVATSLANSIATETSDRKKDDESINNKIDGNPHLFFDTDGYICINYGTNKDITID